MKTELLSIHLCLFSLVQDLSEVWVEQGRVRAFQSWWLREGNIAFGSRQTWFCFPALALTGCVTWGKGLDLSGLCGYTTVRSITLKYGEEQANNITEQLCKLKVLYQH